MNNCLGSGSINFIQDGVMSIFAPVDITVATVSKERRASKESMLLKARRRFTLSGLSIIVDTGSNLSSSSML